AARSIIILASDRDAPDTHTIKTMLALLNNPERKPEPYHVVADIRDRQNLSAARIVGRDEAQLLLGRELISALTVQTGRQPGLSAVYSELLSFAGNEIYFKLEPTLVGQTFGRALFAYEDSALIGLHRAQTGTCLNPPMDTLIAADDQLIIIAEDEDRIRLSDLADYSVDSEALQAPPQRQRAPERTLVLGWNRHGSSMLGALDEYVAPGSATAVVADEPAAEKRVAASHTSLANQTVTFQLADTTDRGVLDALGVPSYNHVLVLSYSDRLGVQEADARTLVTLLHLRDMAERHGKPFSIVSEMLDLRNRQLAEATKADDFIVSDHLVSLMLAQISENKHLTGVLAELVDPEGMEIYLKPVEDYVRLEHAVSFYTLLEAAQRRGEVAIGYRLVGDSRREAGPHGVAINPRKSERVAFAAGDKVIVVAES
ncbi:MAG: NAD-binding protein, partial [Chloroflexi bacterium]|nr:NAD-binding protein [Chloroflexota bacterium]